MQENVYAIIHLFFTTVKKWSHNNEVKNSAVWAHQILTFE